MTESIKTIEDIQSELFYLISRLEMCELDEHITTKHFFGIYHEMINIHGSLDVMLKDMKKEEEACSH